MFSHRTAPDMVYVILHTNSSTTADIFPFLEIVHAAEVNFFLFCFDLTNDFLLTGCLHLNFFRTITYCHQNGVGRKAVSQKCEPYTVVTWLAQKSHLPNYIPPTFRNNIWDLFNDFQ